MIKSFILLSSLSLCSAVISSPVVAARPTVAPASQTIHLPFTPPLGTTLTYRFTQSETRNGRPQTTSFDSRISFVRGGDGYTMTVTSDLPPGTPPGVIATLAQRPFSLRLGADGTVLGLVDEPGYWAAVDELTTALYPPNSNPTERQVAASVIARFRALPHDEFIAMICQNILPIIAYTGQNLALGETRLPAQERQTLMGPITSQGRAIHEIRSDGAAQVTIIATIPAEQLWQATVGLLRELGSARPVDSSHHITAYEQRSVYIVSQQTGLTIRWTSTRTVTTDAPGDDHEISRSRELQLIP